MKKNDVKDATFATVILGVTAMCMGTMFASAAPTHEEIPAPTQSIITGYEDFGGNLSFGDEGGSLLGD